MVGLLVLFALAGAFTSMWLGAVLYYLSASLGWQNLITLPPSDLALVVAGAFGPVAACWLLVAFLQLAFSARRQEQALRLSLAQNRRAADQIEAQVRTLIQMQAESRRRSVIDGMDLVLKDLNGQAAVLAERLGMISQSEADTLWARTVSGDVWAFAYAFLTRAAAYPDFPDLLAERLVDDDVSTSALQIFLRRYDSLLVSFKQNDADKLARAVLEDGPLARLHGLFAQVDHRSQDLRLRRYGPQEAPEEVAMAAGHERRASAVTVTEEIEVVMEAQPADEIVIEEPEEASEDAAGPAGDIGVDAGAKGEDPPAEAAGAQRHADRRQRDLVDDLFAEAGDGGAETGRS